MRYFAWHTIKEKACISLDSSLSLQTQWFIPPKSTRPDTLVLSSPSYLIPLNSKIWDDTNSMTVSWNFRWSILPYLCRRDSTVNRRAFLSKTCQIPPMPPPLPIVPKNTCGSQPIFPILAISFSFLIRAWACYEIGHMPPTRPLGS